MRLHVRCADHARRVHLSAAPARMVISGSCTRASAACLRRLAVSNTRYESFSNASTSIVASIEEEVSLITGRNAKQPVTRPSTVGLELKHQLQGLLHKCAQQPNNLSASNIREFVELAISSGQIAMALELVEAASAAEARGRVSTGALLSFDVFHRLLTIATYSQDMELGDRLMSIALQSPSTRLDVKGVELYATLVGDAVVPDAPRALAFCNLVMELGHNAFAPYIAAVKRTHGESGIGQVIGFFAAEAMAYDALRCVQTALLNLGSVHVDRLFAKMVDAVDEKLSAGVEPSSSSSSTTTTLEDRRQQLLEESYELAINGLLQTNRIDAADVLLNQGWSIHKLSLMYSTFLVAKKLVNVLSLDKPTTFAETQSVVAEALQLQQPETSHLIGCEDSAVQQSRLVALIRCLSVLIQHQALRPRLLFNAMVVLRAFGLCSENLQLVQSMLDDPVMRPNLLASRHINPLLVDLIKAGRIHDAESLFERIHSLDAKYRHSRPNAKTFNILIHHAAKQGDREMVKELMSRMSEAGLKPDASTLAAIPMLRNSKLFAGQSDPGLEERDADDLLDKSISAAGDATTELAVGRNTFNQIMQTYFRLNRPAKALQVVRAMNSVRASAAQDTLRTLLYGVTLAGGEAVTGTPASQIPVTWGGGLSAKDYTDQRRQATVLRARVAAGSVTGQQPSEVLEMDDAKQLRMAAVGETLGWIRAAVFASLRLSGAKDTAVHVDSDVCAQLGCEWLTTESGKNLLNQLERFAAWPRDAVDRQQQLQSALQKETEREASVLRSEATARFRAKIKFARDLTSSDDESGMEDEEEAVIRLEEAVEKHADLLPLFPRILTVLRSMGMTQQDTFRQGDLALSWAATFLSARRSLQLFATLYNIGLWDDKLTIGTRASKLVPGLTTVDLRRVHVASACMFFHVFLSNLATCYIQGRPVPYADQDIAFLVGLKPGRLHAQMIELAKFDIVPKITLLPSERALVWRKNDVKLWLEAELQRVREVTSTRVFKS